MIHCPVCRSAYVLNTVFCTDCGLYLLHDEELATDPLETAQVKWQGATHGSPGRHGDLPDTESLVIRLRISNPRSPLGRPGGRGAWSRELVLPLAKPIRLGRMDPMESIFPDIDLTNDLARQRGVSREHACILRQGRTVLVEDLASTNGTMLNGKLLAPYMPELLKGGDQLQLGKLLIEVSFEAYQPEETPTGERVA